LKRCQAERNKPSLMLNVNAACDLLLASIRGGPETDLLATGHSATARICATAICQFGDERGFDLDIDWAFADKHRVRP
jgi:hypothetical protein